MNVTYLLPIKASAPPPRELTDYLRTVATWCEVLIVDGSMPSVFATAHQQWSGFAIHVPVDVETQWANGKAAGVMTGLARPGPDIVVIADDDVRYDRESFERVVGLLDVAECVNPQNYFSPLPWHARWDTARSVLNRAFGYDPAGTLAVRRSTLEACGGYDGDVLFENLEMMRTVEAVGGRVVTPLDCFVARRPPTTAHFLRQRVRQAYDEFARPTRMALSLSLLPLMIALMQRRRFAAAVAVFVALPIALAEAGRHRGGAATVFPASASLWAPVWTLERSIGAWVAVAARLRGGVRYSGGRLRRAATPVAELRRRHRRAVPS